MIGMEFSRAFWMFADDILLFATSKAGIRKMLKDLKVAASIVGLQLHMGKTKVLTNTAQIASHIQVDAETVEILQPGGCTMYLGRNLSLSSQHEVELENRLKHI